MLWKSFQSGKFMASSYDFFDVSNSSEFTTLKFIFMKSTNKIFILCYSVSKSNQMCLLMYFDCIYTFVDSLFRGGFKKINNLNRVMNSWINDATKSNKKWQLEWPQVPCCIHIKSTFSISLTVWLIGKVENLNRVFNYLESEFKAKTW